MSSISRSLRLVQVLETVEELKIATPADVLQRVAQKLQESPTDGNFKRSIYRDLSDLADEGRLNARYLSQDGQEIRLDDLTKHKNVRVEYSLRGVVTQSIKGIGILEALGGAFIPSVVSTLNWRVVNVDHLEFNGSVNLIFEAKLGQLAALQMDYDQLPACLLISRLSENETDISGLGRAVTAKHGPRSAVLLSWDRSVSRFATGKRLGHCLLEISKEGKVSVSDLDSSSGTSVKASPDIGEGLERLIKTQKSGATQSREDSPFFSPRGLEKIIKQEVAPTFLLQLGGLNLILQVHPRR